MYNYDLIRSKRVNLMKTPSLLVYLAYGSLEAVKGRDVFTHTGWVVEMLESMLTSELITVLM